MYQGYVGKPTKNMVHVADFFFFSIRQHTKIPTSKGIITSLQCWNFLKKELFMMARSVINPLNKQKKF